MWRFGRADFSQPCRRIAAAAGSSFAPKSSIGASPTRTLYVHARGRHNLLASTAVTRWQQPALAAPGTAVAGRAAHHWRRFHGERFFFSWFRGKVAQTEDDEDSKTILLYQRKPSRAALPRLFVALSVFQTSYWSWYLVDFVPRMKEALVLGHRYDPIKGAYEAAPTLSSTGTGGGGFGDDLVGYVGFGMACLITLGAITYPRCLVSEIREEVASGDLLIKTHSLPFVSVPLKARQYQKVYADATKEWYAIHKEHGGRLSQFRGNLVLQINPKKSRSWWNPSNICLLDIGDASEVKNEMLLLRKLLPLGDDEDEKNENGNGAPERYVLEGKKEKKKLPVPPPGTTATMGGKGKRFGNKFGLKKRGRR